MEMLRTRPDTSSLVTANGLNTKISEGENKTSDHAKNVTTQTFHKLTAENFAAILTQANLARRTDFAQNLITFNTKITSNKTKYIEIVNKLNSLTTKYYIFFLGITYFISNDGSQNLFAYQPTLHMLELRKDKYTDCILLNLSHCLLLS